MADKKIAGVGAARLAPSKSKVPHRITVRGPLQLWWLGHNPSSDSNGYERATLPPPGFGSSRMAMKDVKRGACPWAWGMDHWAGS